MRKHTSSKSVTWKSVLLTFNKKEVNRGSCNPTELAARKQCCIEWMSRPSPCCLPMSKWWRKQGGYWWRWAGCSARVAWDGSIPVRWLNDECDWGIFRLCHMRKNKFDNILNWNSQVKWEQWLTGVWPNFRVILELAISLFICIIICKVGVHGSAAVSVLCCENLCEEAMLQ